jgi:hypothetical protein
MSDEHLRRLVKLAKAAERLAETVARELRVRRDEIGYTDRRAQPPHRGDREVVPRPCQNLIQSQIQTSRQNIHYQIQVVSRLHRPDRRDAPVTNSHSVTRLRHTHDGFKRHAGLGADAFRSLRPRRVLPGFGFRVQRLRHTQELGGIPLVEAERGPPRLQGGIGSDSFHDVIVGL